MGGDQAAYRRVLRLIWEGIIIEYWRGLGKSIKHYKFDLRHMVWKYWLRGREEAENPSHEWLPIYSPLEDRPDRVVEEQVTDDDRVSTWVKGMQSQERAVKDAERTLRLSTYMCGCIVFFVCVCVSCRELVLCECSLFFAGFN